MDLHLRPDLRAFKEHKTRQTKGVDAAMMKRMVAWATRRAHGQGSLWDAVMSLMWAGLLRPGEAWGVFYGAWTPPPPFRIVRFRGFEVPVRREMTVHSH